jgi:hypothetical protein
MKMTTKIIIFLGRVVFPSDRIFAHSRRKAGCHQPFDFFKIG